MTISTILRHDAIGETRLVALDKEGQAVALFVDRWIDKDERLQWGETLAGHIRKLSPGDGGAFIGLENGMEGFLPQRDLTGLVEGAEHVFQVSAEARKDKLARLRKTDQAGSQPFAPVSNWLENLPVDPADLSWQDDADAHQTITDVFDDALVSKCPLPGGGRLQITPTPALVAVDVDTIGRRDKGRASARAKAVGLAAAEELARQASLRSLGGALVLDCIAPLARRDGPDIKARFVETFRSLSTRRAECLPPSPFGLMEAVLERRERPLAETYLQRDGSLTPESCVLAGLRQVEREAKASPATRLRLGLPAAALSAYEVHRNLYDPALIERFGGRIEVGLSKHNKIEVSHP